MSNKAPFDSLKSIIFSFGTAINISPLLDNKLFKILINVFTSVFEKLSIEKLSLKDKPLFLNLSFLQNKSGFSPAFINISLLSYF